MISQDAPGLVFLDREYYAILYGKMHQISEKICIITVKDIVYYPKKKTLSEKLSQLVSGNPKISVNKIMNDLGIEMNDINMLNRMKYDLILPPLKISM